VGPLSHPSVMPWGSGGRLGGAVIGVPALVKIPPADQVVNLCSACSSAGYRHS
jgi:hypothetical protein